MSALALSLLAAVTVAFPRNGAKLPAVERCYLIGATDGAETNLVVQGRSVPVHRSGAFTAMLDLKPGTNVVRVADRSLTLFVPAKSAGTGKAAPKKAYRKLEYAESAPAKKGARAVRKPVVFIDAGHGGGTDLGAVSPHALPEKDANLRLAVAVAEELAKHGIRVEMTRTGDVAIELYERPRQAHADKADAFVSIHHNAPPYTADPSALRYHAVYCWNAIGEKLAKAINVRMGGALDGIVPNKGVLHANFAVTRSPQIPSCLVEADFITHPDGELAAWNADHRRRLAAAIAAGIADFVKPRTAEERK